MATLAQSKQFQKTEEYYRSGNLPFVNGSSLTFAHGWVDFNPVLHWHKVQIWAICTQAQNGWALGERVLLDRGVTVSIDGSNIYATINGNGIEIERRDGNLKTIVLDTNRWQLYVMGVRHL